jgi:WhiB family redox-sensing transcriptional regulator
MMLVPFYDDAACRGANTDQFFVGVGESAQAAKRICEGCKVKDVCRDWAIKYKITFGIWGGTTQRDRRKIAKELVTAGVLT